MISFICKCLITLIITSPVLKMLRMLRIAIRRKRKREIFKATILFIIALSIYLMIMKFMVLTNA